MSLVYTPRPTPPSGGGSSTPRVTQQPFVSTITPNAATTDILVVAPLTGNVTMANPSGTPVDGQNMRMRFTQDTTGGRTITWGGAYAFTDNVTPASFPTTAGKRCTVMLSWDAAYAKWVVLAMAPY